MKIRKLICLVLSLVLLSAAFRTSVVAEELKDGDVFTYGDYRCKIVNGAVSIIEYLGEDGYNVDLVVPETINGYMVKYIGKNAFGEIVYDMKTPKFNYIKLPDTIETIGFGAFGMTSAKINFPKSAKYIGEASFFMVEEVVFDKNDDYTICLPTSLEYIGKGAYYFKDCKINISENLIYFDKRDFFDHNVAICAPRGSYAGKIAEDNAKYVGYMPTGYCTGDIDKNGEVNVNDMMSLKTYILSADTKDEILDIDKNGEVNVNDMMSLKSRILNPKVATAEWTKSIKDLFRLISK